MNARLVEAIDRRKIPLYGNREVELRLTDRDGTRRIVYISCEAVDIKVYDLILGID